MIATCNQVGSGKSSLLNSILGEMLLIHGSIHSQGSIAYVSQVCQDSSSYLSLLTESFLLFSLFFLILQGKGRESYKIYSVTNYDR